MEPTLPRTSYIQRLFAYVGFALAVCWLIMQIVGPFVEYMYGRGPLSVLISGLSTNLLIGLLVFAGVTFLLGWAGVFPRQATFRQTISAYGINGRGLLMGIAFAVVGTLALIAIAMLYPPFGLGKRLTALVLDIGPMLLLIGTWIAVLFGHWLDRRRRNKSSDSGE